MPKHTSPFTTRKKTHIFHEPTTKGEKKYNQTVYAELLQAMVWNNKCALCAATGTGKSYIAAKFVQEAVIEQDTLILVPFDEQLDHKSKHAYLDKGRDLHP